MGYALLYSGQGAQHPGMLPWLARDASVIAVEQRLGGDWRARLADPAWAGDNAHAQCLLTGLALAATAQLVAELGPPSVVAGYSVGELPAFAAAGVMAADTALQLAEQRARCMDAAAAGVATGLIALSGHSGSQLAALCAACDLDVALRLAPDSAVLGGERHALADAARQADALGLQTRPLNVALASHTRWMRPALAPFGAALQAATLRAPALPLVSNVLGRVHDAATAAQALQQQLADTVRWDECQELVAAQGVTVVLEIGPQQALARMWNTRWPAVPARSADEFRSLASLVRWVAKHLDER